jgi:hypothetical protein
MSEMTNRGGAAAGEIIPSDGVHPTLPRIIVREG